jgi:dTDP-4-dehydrorhamnose 3,5-epimerase
MSFTQMQIQGAWIHNPLVHLDNRGTFHEVVRISELENKLGAKFPVVQVNQSMSRKGVIRGVHSAKKPMGQAKYVSCAYGMIWDVVVDLRSESPTFGNWDAVFLTAENKKSVLIPEGLGHAFLSLSDSTIVNYLCSREYSAEHEITINPLDARLNIHFEKIANDFEIANVTLSEKDSEARNFSDLILTGGAGWE